jgi:hypothetical protein
MILRLASSTATSAFRSRRCESAFTARADTMTISAKLAALFSIVFAAVCLGFAITGFSSLGDIADPQQASDARGFAWFWSFLAGVAVVFGLLSWWMAHPKRDSDDG